MTRRILITKSGANQLSYSGKAAHRAFSTQGQEAFLEGHVHAFCELGGVPVTHIRYDNLKSAVSRVLFGHNRTESQRWLAFRSHYGFDAFYCQPGKEGAHEKGGVERLSDPRTPPATYVRVAVERGRCLLVSHEVLYDVDGHAVGHEPGRVRVAQFNVRREAQ